MGLGSFQLMKYFLEYLGKVLEESGIEELLSVVYGSMPVPHILNRRNVYFLQRAEVSLLCQNSSSKIHSNWQWRGA